MGRVARDCALRRPAARRRPIYVPQGVRLDVPPLQPLAVHVQCHGCVTTKSQPSLTRRTIKWVLKRTDS